MTKKERQHEKEKEKMKLARETTEWRFVQLVEIVSNPTEHNLGAKEIFEKYDIPISTTNAIKRKASFYEEVKMVNRNRAIENTAPIFDALINKAKSGHAPSIKLFFEVTRQYETFHNHKHEVKHKEEIAKMTTEQIIERIKQTSINFVSNN